MVDPSVAVRGGILVFGPMASAGLIVDVFLKAAGENAVCFILISLLMESIRLGALMESGI